MQRRTVAVIATVAAVATLLSWLLSVVPGVTPAGAPLFYEPASTLSPQAPGIAIASARFDLPDPYLLDVGRTYDLYVSTAQGDSGQHIPVLKGSPGHWSNTPTDAVRALPSWASTSAGVSGLNWSPAVYQLGKRYLMYFAPTLKVATHHCVAVGVSTSPTGQFLVAPNPIVCQWDQGGDIDAQLFVDPAGPEGPAHPNYLVWKSDNNSLPGSGTPTIWSAPLSNDGLHLTGVPVKIFQPDETWQESLVEAPELEMSPQGQVWLFYSGGAGYFSVDYGMGAARCDGPLGPCRDLTSVPLITSNAQGTGPGEESYFVAPDGSDWLLYSAIHFDALFYPYRAVEAARIGWNAAGPYVAQAGAFPAP
jgi:GH43 family beta-xylosidase